MVTLLNGSSLSQRQIYSTAEFRIFYTSSYSLPEIIIIITVTIVITIYLHELCFCRLLFTTYPWSGSGRLGPNLKVVKISFALIKRIPGL